MQTEKPQQINSDTHAFKEVLRLRRSCHGSLETPVSDEIITSVFEDAQLAPPNCNTQPWDPISRNVIFHQ